ncbi:MAG: DUF3027 domain-containing protein [Bifidobacteriaceae bacterium]|jgi:hypothetical protein|nr:DUF3027 domain-containing protein [Bifidobacteriaceae bacterium]
MTGLTKLDATLTGPATVERARAALAELAPPEHVGDYLGAQMIGDRVADLRFDCRLPGYVGWAWTVTVARVPRSRTATVSELELLPGDRALLAPAWIPWAERLQPGDLGPNDVLPHIVEDPRLTVSGLDQTADDESEVDVAHLALGRVRVLSPSGRAAAGTRWYDSQHGPDPDQANKTAAPCQSCGFLVPLVGALGALFGVCANEWSNLDGQVVSLDHGCGAHSETDMLRTAVEWPENDPLVDDAALEPLD